MCDNEGSKQTCFRSSLNFNNFKNCIIEDSKINMISNSY